MADRIEHELSAAEAAALTAATRDAMAAAGELGGSIGGAFGGTSRAGAAGGRAGGRFGARFLKPRSAGTTFEVALAPQAVLARTKDAIERHGVVIEDPNAAGDGSVWGVVASGVADMAPALVCVQVETTATGGARVRIRATGMEGLIKQKIAGKAVDRIAAVLAAQE